MENRIVRYTQDSHFQRIRASYLEENIQLTEYEEKLAEQLKFIYTHRLKNKFSKQQVIDKIISVYQLSKATAYRRYDMSMQLFGEIDEVNVRAEKIILAEQYWHLYQMNLRERNWDAAKKALDSYKELFDFSKSEETMDFDKIKANNYHISLDRLSKSYFKKQISSGVFDFNMNAEDIDFEKIENEGEE